MEQEFLDDPEFKELIKQYLDYLTDTLPSIKEQITKNNFLEIQKFGHNLKGSGGGYGLNEFSKLGAEIENASKVQNKKIIESQIQEFETMLNSARKNIF